MNRRDIHGAAVFGRERIVFASLFVFWLLTLAPPLPAGTGNDDPDGATLAREMRDQAAVGAGEFAGELVRESADGTLKRVPINMVTEPMPGGFRTIFRSIEMESGVPTTLTIVRVTGEMPGYLLSRQSAETGRPGPPEYLSGSEAMRSFAGGDFWLTDLGFDFFYWPNQKFLRSQMTRGRACDVLESSVARDARRGYVRVLSWIDRETRGVVKAEAYGPDGKLVKEFKPKEFKKIDGQWRVRELEITDERSGSRTRLVLDLSA